MSYAARTDGVAQPRRGWDGMGALRVPAGSPEARECVEVYTMGEWRPDGWYADVRDAIAVMQHLRRFFGAAAVRVRSRP